MPAEAPAGAALAPSGAPAFVDLHVDLSYRARYAGGTVDAGSGQFRADALVRASVAGVVLPLFVPAEVRPGGPSSADLEESWRTLVEALRNTPPYAEPGCRAAPGRVRTFLAFEGAAPLAGDPGAAARWAARGVRLFGLVHKRDNALAASGTGARPGGGLTPAGRALVREVHRAGAIVDVSHASRRTVHEVVALARVEGRPVVATHSNASALTPHARNLDDDTIRAIASTGGLVGVTFHSRFLSGAPRATIDDVVRHALHLVSVAGAAHVGIGSDFEGDIRTPEGLPDVSALPELARRLASAGLSPAVVAALAGGNALRILCPGGAAASPGRVGGGSEDPSPDDPGSAVAPGLLRGGEEHLPP
ncbi:MAG: membrane dipeptidase [Deltaproteobacteria bacterium]|nr:membrane dipeptidase [Deltaproteobacteria bacterium]